MLPPNTHINTPAASLFIPGSYSLGHSGEIKSRISPSGKGPETQEEETPPKPTYPLFPASTSTSTRTSTNQKHDKIRNRKNNLLRHTPESNCSQRMIREQEEKRQHALNQCCPEHSREPPCHLITLPRLTSSIHPSTHPSPFPAYPPRTGVFFSFKERSYQGEQDKRKHRLTNLQLFLFHLVQRSDVK